MKKESHILLIENNEGDIVMPTSSDSEKDILEAYASRVNCFITKPAGFQGFINVITMLKEFGSVLYNYLNKPPMMPGEMKIVLFRIQNVCRL